MKLDLIVIILGCIGLLLCFLSVELFIVYKNIRQITKKGEAYVNYILSDEEPDEAVSDFHYIEENQLKERERAQDEKIFQEVLDGFFS